MNTNLSVVSALVESTLCCAVLFLSHTPTVGPVRDTSTPPDDSLVLREFATRFLLWFGPWLICALLSHGTPTSPPPDDSLILHDLPGDLAVSPTAYQGLDGDFDVGIFVGKGSVDDAQKSIYDRLKVWKASRVIWGLRLMTGFVCMQRRGRCFVLTVLIL